MEQPKALEELRNDESSRGAFLKMVGGAGAAGALGIFLAACGDDDDDEAAQTSTEKSTAKSGMTDAEIVNYALTLEYLERDFYRDVIESGEVTDKKIAETAKMILENEQAHVDALKGTAENLGGKVAAAPMTNFDDVLAGGPDKILETAATVENLGAAAYLGQAGNITDKEILAAALSIHTVEGRHAAALNQLVGKSIVPDGAFAKPATEQEVLKAVQPFIQS